MLDYTDLYRQYGIDTIDPLIAHYLAYGDCPTEADADIAQIFKQVEQDFKRWDAPRSMRSRSRTTHSPGHSQRGLHT